MPEPGWKGIGKTPYPSLLIRNFGLDEFGQQGQRFLPAKIAGFRRNCCGYARLGNAQFGSAEYLFQDDGRFHFSWQAWGIEFIRVTDPLVGYQFEVRSAEGMAAARGEIGERHPVTAANFGLEAMDLACESVWWKPFRHRVGVKESAIGSLRRCTEHSVESDSICVIG